MVNHVNGMDIEMVPVQTMSILLEELLVSKISKIMQEALPWDCNALSRVSTKWYKCVTPNLGERILNYITFDKEKWLKIPGVIDVSDMALTPEQKEKLIDKIKKRCPFFNAPDGAGYEPHRFQNDKLKRVWQTHIVILYPEKINGEPRTLASQGKLFHFLRQGKHDSCYRYILNKDLNQYAPPSYFGLVTLDLVPNSRGKKFKVKERLVKDQGYRLPKTPNEAVTSIAIMNLGPSKDQQGYYFGQYSRGCLSLGNYTITQQISQANLYYIVGAVDSLGIGVNHDYADEITVGAAGIAEVL